MKTIEISDEQYKDWERGKPIKKTEKWQPPHGKYFVDHSGRVSWIVHHSRSALEFGTEYPTRELAIRARDFMKPHHRLVAYALEHWPDYEPDKEVIAHFPVYDRRDKEWYVSNYEVGRNPWVPYGPYNAVSELVKKLNRWEMEL